VDSQGVYKIVDLKKLKAEVTEWSLKLYYIFYFLKTQKRE